MPHRHHRHLSHAGMAAESYCAIIAAFRLMTMCAPLSGELISNSLKPDFALSLEAALYTVCSGAKSVHDTSTCSPPDMVSRLSVAMIVVLRITSNAFFLLILFALFN